MRRTTSPLLISVVLTLGGCSEPAPEPSGTERAQIVIEADGGTVRLDVEVADDADERQVGLMGRTSLEEDAGMVFVFPEPTAASFWMKDTLIPLSIAFWNDDGAVAAILDMEPCEADPCPSYDPGVEFTFALEVNQG
ncbi:MAG: DUF192 domain-containing protein, partial [Actinomycetota bacterium]